MTEPLCIIHLQRTLSGYRSARSEEGEQTFEGANVKHQPGELNALLS